MGCKKYLAMILGMTLLLSGCGMKEKENTEAVSRVVVDSEGTNIQVWTVSEMDILDTEVYEGRVTPYAEELYFSGEGQFGEYLVHIGDEVKKGQKLAKTAEDEEKLEALREESAQLQNNYQYQLQSLENQLDIGELQLQAIYDQLELETSGTKTFTQLCEKAGIQDQKNKRIQLEITQLKEEYQLQNTWKNKQIQQCREQTGQNIITAPFDGVVTNLLPVLQGQELDWKGSYVAVADTSRYQIVCDYIGQNSMKGLERAYAIVNGQEIELTHVPYEEDVYREIRAAQEKCYSFFEMENKGNIALGDYAVVVTVKQSAEQVLAVPALAVQNDSGGVYVYRMEDGEKIKCYIETGVYDGAYYEVIHGVNQGDEIFVALEGDVLPDKGGNEIPIKRNYGRPQKEDEEPVAEQTISEYLDMEALEAVRQGNKTAVEYDTQVLEKGDFVVDWTKNASVSMTQQKVVAADYDSGIMYFDGFTVDRYDYVEAGQCIATVSVQIDEIALEEKEQKLARLKERYARDEQTYVADREEKLAHRVWKSEIDNKVTDLQFAQEQLQWNKQAAGYQQQIKELEEQIAELKKVRNITEIKAPVSGYVMSLENFVQGKELKNQEMVALMLPSEGVLLEIEDAEMDFGYGMTSQLKMGKQQTQTDCTAINVTGRSIRGDLSATVAAFRAACTVEELMAQKGYTISGVAANVKDVVLVPTEAVYHENEILYVIVKTPEGRYEKRVFTAGGNSKEWYWVLFGLEEGLEVVTEQ